MSGTPAPYEEVWAKAVAEEHAHQLELLAVLREELGTFARECSSALSSLDAFIGLAGVAEAVSTARTSMQYASLAHDIARRLSADDQLADLYDAVGSGERVPPALVRHAGGLVRSGPRRTDRELLQAVVSAAGVSGQIERIIGPAPMAALAALRPLSRLAAALHRGEGDASERLAAAGGDLTKVLQATAALGAGSAVATAADVTALADSLRETVAHVEGAAQAIEHGKLEKVLSESRLKLEEDLGALRRIHEDAREATPEWRAARKAEHEELSEEVRVKLDRVERTRRVLATLLPRLQLLSRALSTAGRIHALEGRLDPEPAAGIAAAYTSLVAAADAVWTDAVSSGPPTAVRRSPLRGRTRWLVGAVVVIGAIALAIVLATGGSSKRGAPSVSTAAQPTTTSAAATPVQPTMSGVKAVFSQAQRATTYAVSVTAAGQGTPTITWRLVPPKDNPGCNKFAPVPGEPNKAVWHHADTDGCTHNGIQHAGTVYATVTTNAWTCTQSFFGTLTRQGSSAETCRRL